MRDEIEMDDYDPIKHGRRERNFEKEVDEAVQRGSYAMKKLATAVSGLPQVSKEGHSDCPFAKQLYVQKEEAHNKADAALSRLERVLEDVNKEIARCRNNMKLLEQGKDDLKTPRTRGGYSGAITAQAGQYKRALEQRKKLLDLIGALKALLKESARKKYPGMDHEDSPKPKSKVRFPVVPPATTSPSPVVPPQAPVPTAPSVMPPGLPRI